MKPLLRQPALHFFAIGALLFAADSYFGRPPSAAAPPRPGELSAERLSDERITALQAGWLATTGVAPGPEATQALIRAELDDELWIAEARRRGLHQSDALVRRRLVRNMRFVAEGAGKSDDELFEEALELGMDLRDPVVRRRLVQVMKLGVSAAARSEEPTESELRAHLEENRERFSQPARVRLSQVYLSRDRRGDRLVSDAEALLATLAWEDAGPELAAERGDPFLIPAHLPARSDAELTREFGDGFVAGLVGLEPGGWAGPVPSAYGLHLVWLHERVPGAAPSLAAVRVAVRESLLSERADRAVERALRQLRVSP